MDANRLSTVLVVDNDPNVVEAIADGLLSRGFPVIKSWNAGHALNNLLSKDVGVLVAQRGLPGYRGLSGFAAEASVSWPHLAVVVVTNDEEASHGFAPGRISTLHRPFNLGSLLVAVAKAQALVTGGLHPGIAA